MADTAMNWPGLLRQATPTNRFGILGRMNSGRSSSKFTGCQKKCRWVKIAKIGGQPHRCERNFLTQIFRFFTQSDVEVGANYMEHYMPLFKADRGIHDAGKLLEYGNDPHRCLRLAT